jgi:integrase
VTTDWEWASQNPVLGIRKPKEPRGRERYLSEHELQKLLSACQASSSSHLHDVVVLALCTGMRRGEIVGLRWPMVDFTRGFIRLSLTKNGTSRSVPLVEPALGQLAARHKVRRIDTDRVFPAASGDGEWDLKKAWTTALRKAEIGDFRFHDLRHTAASYLAMNGATTVQLAAILGHKTLAMVKRYAHLSDTHNAAVVESMAKRMFNVPQGEVRHG